MSFDAEEAKLEKARCLSEEVMPGLEEGLAKRYDDLLPGFSESIVGMAWGDIYGRGGLDMKTRLLATIASLATLGGQTKPQLKIQIRAAQGQGATRREIAEVIMQMGLYGGFPAMINALNAALEVFEEDG